MTTIRWLVRLALRRPLSIAVIALLMLVRSVLSIAVVIVVWIRFEGTVTRHPEVLASDNHARAPEDAWVAINLGQEVHDGDPVQPIEAKK